MRELERSPSFPPTLPRHLAVIGRGRVGRAMAAALRATGPGPEGPLSVTGPLGRDWSSAELTGPAGARDGAVLLCVPDGALAELAARLPEGLLVGHCSGASPLAVLAHHEAFSLHPLMTVTAEGAPFSGAGAAVAGSSPRALAFAQSLAERLGMSPFKLAEADRAVYHAAASLASNFLVTLEGAAERLAGEAGLDRALLLPLVRAAVENWGAHGARAALTGPVARGDLATVAAQRRAVAERTPGLLALFDALVAATRELAAAPAGGDAPPRLAPPPAMAA